MKRLLAVALLLAAACDSRAATWLANAARRPAASASPGAKPQGASSKTFDIGNGVVLRVERDEAGACTTTALAGDQQLWSDSKCLGTKQHPWFLSRDREWLLVVDSEPSLAAGSTEVPPLARLYRRGVPSRSLGFDDLGVSREAMRIENGALHWLGEDPRATADGVDFRLSDWTQAAFRWPPVAPKPVAAALAAPSSCEPCSYVDEQGVYHLAANADEIPDRYRAQARAVRGEVNVYSAPPRSKLADDANARQPWEIVHEQAMQKKAAAAEAQARAAGHEAMVKAQEQAANRRWSNEGSYSPPRCFDNSMKPRPCDDGEIRQADQNRMNALIRAHNPGYNF
jgi:hypothetical protein